MTPEQLEAVKPARIKLLGEITRDDIIRHPSCTEFVGQGTVRGMSPKATSYALLKAEIAVAVQQLEIETWEETFRLQQVECEMAWSQTNRLKREVEAYQLCAEEHDEICGNLKGRIQQLEAELDTTPRKAAKLNAQREARIAQLEAGLCGMAVGAAQTAEYFVPGKMAGMASSVDLVADMETCVEALKAKAAATPASRTQEAEDAVPSPYCDDCGACGEADCCPPTQCKYVNLYNRDYAADMAELERWHKRMRRSG